MKKRIRKMKNAGWGSPATDTTFLGTSPIENALPVQTFSDGKFTMSHGPGIVNGIVPFPGYLNNPKFPFGSIFPKVAGVYSWMQGDSEENFVKNKDTQSATWKYLTKPITYTLNRHGYRAPEWEDIDWKNSVVLFGDSCTYGVGVSDEETIGFQLAQLLGRPVINLGVGGGSNTLMIHNATHLLEYFPTPYAVANIWSTTNRFRFFTEFHTYDAGAWDQNAVKVSEHTNVGKLWELTFADPTHELGLAFYEGKIAKAIWQDRTKYASLSFFGNSAHYTRSDEYFVIDNKARDLIHPGEESCREVAQFLYGKFK
jgi:hypothetical protein|tara:strand:+ start:2858 stop:3796 length:939 start_codon:yes stop_codon:yes gene_type:complete